MRSVRALLLLGISTAVTALGAADAAAQSARLSLETVFGQPATAFAIPFGTIDIDCTSTAPAGVTCVQAPGGDPPGAWSGDTVCSRTR